MWQKTRYIICLNAYSLCDSCVGTILSDISCTSKWFLHDDKFADPGGKNHATASTLVECQKACEFDPRCVAVDWQTRVGRRCLIFTNPNHNHSSVANDRWKHYELVSRCNITPGQCFASDVISILKQESWAIAKMTARCVQYTGALKNFESPWLRPRLLFPKFVMGFCSDRY